MSRARPALLQSRAGNTPISETGRLDRALSLATPERTVPQEMTILRLAVREIAHRKLNFLLSLLGAVTAVSLFVAFFTTAAAARRETTRLMRDLGYNLRILPGETDMDRFWAAGYADRTMPESHVQRLAGHENISYAHLSATLHWRLNWRGREILLTGIAPEVAPPGKQKPSMRPTIRPGTVLVGFELAQGLGLRSGDRVEIRGWEFTVDRCLPEAGSQDDIRVFGHLGDVQGLLGMEGRINEIEALQCLCIVDGVNVDSLAVLRDQLARVLPDTRVVMLQSIATARERQRVMVEQYFGVALPFAAAGSLIWIGLLALLNVREREPEVGVLRALGYGSGRIALLFLVRAIAIGLSGATLGYGFGTGLALGWGPEVFKVTAAALAPSASLFVAALWISPCFCALASLVPAMVAVGQDPARTLAKEWG